MLIHDAIEQARRTARWLDELSPLLDRDTLYKEAGLNQGRYSYILRFRKNQRYDAVVFQYQKAVIDSYRNVFMPLTEARVNQLMERGPLYLVDPDDPLLERLNKYRELYSSIYDKMAVIRSDMEDAFPGVGMNIFSDEERSETKSWVVIDTLERHFYSLAEDVKRWAFADAELRSFVAARRSLSANHHGEEAAHDLVLRFDGGPLSVAQCADWLTYLDGVLEYSYAASGLPVEQAKLVRLARLETGSNATALLDIAAEALSKLKDVMLRAVGKDLYEAQVAQAKAEAARIAAEASMTEGEAVGQQLGNLEHIHRMIEAGVVTVQQGAEMKRKLALRARLEFLDDVSAIEFDGEDLADRKRLEPAHTSLPPLFQELPSDLFELADRETHRALPPGKPPH